MNKDKICSKSCMYQWRCSHCANLFCDDIHSPKLVLEGKIEYINKIGDIIPKRFYLCGQCKKSYIERNQQKGRYKNKIMRKSTSMW